tara:strand:+ start:3528 stop:5039 length:1512 start_codon:yes stop_codon:yes gene_type:complete
MVVNISSPTEEYNNNYPSGSSKKVIKSYNKKYGVCGQGNYVKNDYWRQDPNHTHPCHKCPKEGKEAKEANTKLVKDIYDNYDRYKIDNIPDMNKKLKEAGVPHPPRNASDIGLMCSPYITEWFPKQHDANPYLTKLKSHIDWKKISTVIENDKAANDKKNSKYVDLAAKWYTERLDDNFFETKIKKGFQYSKGVSQMRKEINDYTNELVGPGFKGIKCKNFNALPSPIKNKIINNNNGVTPSPPIIKCSKKGYMGKDNIISKQWSLWSDDYLFNTKNQHKLGRGDFKLWGKPLTPPNPNFEKCINNVLNENSNDHDKDMIQDIYGKDSIYKLNKKEILFIKRKLHMLFADGDPKEGILKCIKENMMLDNTICEAGLTEQMNFVLNVLFGIIGFKFNIYELDIDDSGNKEKLIYIIDQLGDIIPKALKKIVDISKKLEIAQCGENSISNNTLVLEELYKKIFTPGKSVVNFDFGISDMISTASDKNFDRTTVLMVLGIAFLKFF